MKKTDRNFADTARDVLNDSLDQLDDRTLAELGRLKYRALDSEGDKKSGKPVWAVASVAICLLIIVAINYYPVDRGTFVAPGMADINLLSANEPLEFYAQEIEFYLWYSETDAVDADLPGSGLLDPSGDTDPAPGSGTAGAGRAAPEPGNA